MKARYMGVAGIVTALLSVVMSAEAVVTNAVLSGSARVYDYFPQDGDGDAAADSWSFVGDYSNNIGNPSNRMYRMSYVFALPHGGEWGYSVNGAAFSMILRSISENGNLPDLDVAILDKGTVGDGDKSDYEAAGLATNFSIATPATANETTLNWSNQDLVDALNTAYSNLSTHVAFRPQLARTGDFYDAVNGWAVSDEDALNDVYYIHCTNQNPNSDAYIPELQLDLIGPAGIQTNASLLAFNRVWDNYVQDGSGNANGTGTYCGDIKNNNNLNRGRLIFQLPKRPLGYLVDDATFKIVLAGFTLNPGDTNPDWNDPDNLPPLDIAIVDKGTSTNAVVGDYEAAPLALLEGVATLETTPGTLLSWDTQDLTAALNAAYANDSTAVMLRMQLALTGDWVHPTEGYAISDADQGYDLYQFAAADPAPELAIYFVAPERGTVLLLR
ncbi:MAG: hypothetical protein JW951_06970 [Lentisphaerae bacterium]|nr:hypothetical protein [Lentisphaerota bacterium]